MSVFAPVFRLILIFIFFFFFAVAIFYLISFQSKKNPCNAMFYYETFFPQEILKSSASVGTAIGNRSVSWHPVSECIKAAPIFVLIWSQKCSVSHKWVFASQLHADKLVN